MGVQGKVQKQERLCTCSEFVDDEVFEIDPSVVTGRVLEVGSMGGGDGCVPRRCVPAPEINVRDRRTADGLQKLNLGDYI